MYAVARLNSFDPNKLAASSDALARFDQVHRAQRGYAGTVVRRPACRPTPGTQPLGQRGGQRGSPVGPRARRPAGPESAHVRPVRTHRRRHRDLHRPDPLTRLLIPGTGGSNQPAGSTPRCGHAAQRSADIQGGLGPADTSERLRTSQDDPPTGRMAAVGESQSAWRSVTSSLSPRRAAVSAAGNPSSWRTYFTSTSSSVV